jgi:molybdopterin-binding protein
VNETVARIVGVETILAARVVERAGDLAGLDVQGSRLWAVSRHAVGTQVLVCVRGEDVAFTREAAGESTIRNRLPGRIVALTPEGPLVRVSIDCGFPLTALVTRPASSELGLQPGDVGVALVKATAIHIATR